MTTVSVPVNDEIHQKIKQLIALGVEPNYATFMRKAAQRYAEDLAVEMVLKAQSEPTLSGDLDDLAASL